MIASNPMYTRQMIITLLQIDPQFHEREAWRRAVTLAVKTPPPDGELTRQDGKSRLHPEGEYGRTGTHGHILKCDGELRNRAQRSLKESAHTRTHPHSHSTLHSLKTAGYLNGGERERYDVV